MVLSKFEFPLLPVFCVVYLSYYLCSQCCVPSFFPCCPKLCNKSSCIKASTLALMARNVESSAWVVDSGSTTHLCNDIRLFDALTPFSCEIGTAKSNSAPLVCTHRGTIILRSTKVGNASVTLRDVLFVPLLSTNLISVRKLDIAKYGVNFGKGMCNILDESGEVVLSAPLVQNLYKVEPCHVSSGVFGYPRGSAHTEACMSVRPMLIHSTCGIGV